MSPQFSTPTPRVALAGGKSGGHVFPAIAVAEELGRLGAQVVLMGMADGMEARLAREREIEFAAVGAAAVVGRGLLGKLDGLRVLLTSALAARKVLRRRGVDVVLGTGGFVSVPTVLGAWLARLPIVLLEPNAQPGGANRQLSRLARIALIASEATSARMHCPTRVTGVPVRSAFFDIRAPEPVGSSLHLLILGGSQGAKRLNDELPTILAESLSAAVIVHQCGRGHRTSTEESWARALSKAGHALGQYELTAAGAGTTAGRARFAVRIEEFVDDVPATLEQVDLVISRAGAITLAELCAAGRGSILVPLPLAGGHQVANARLLAASGAARVVLQEDLAQVGGELKELVEHPGRLLEMATAARSLARRDAAARIAETVLDLANERRVAA